MTDRFGIDIDHPDYHPSEGVSAASGPVTIGLPALLTLARWCRQQLAPPEGAAHMPARRLDVSPPAPADPSATPGVWAAIPEDRRREVARVLALALGRRLLPPTPTEGSDDRR